MVDYTRSNEYTLSIRISADGFCFAVHHPERPSEYAFMPYDVDALLPVPANLKAACESLPMLGHTYGSVRMLLADEPYTLVPAEYYTPSDARALFAQNFPCTTDRQEVITEELPAGQYLLSGVDATILRWARNFFPGIVIGHSMNPVLRYALTANVQGDLSDDNNTPPDLFLCNLHARKMDLVCVRDGKLAFAGTFDNDNPDNALYYLLGVWQTLGLSQQDDTLTLAGNASDARELRTALSQYIRHLEVFDATRTFHTSELARIDRIPFDLQALIGMPHTQAETEP